MKVSILIPSYNDCETIAETLDSIKNQTYENWEIVIIDDGSTDNSKKVIQQYILKNNLEKKIRYIYQENKDQLNALINGTQYINGDYVFILHSDDLLPDRDFLEKSIKIMQQENCDAIIGDLLIIDKYSNIFNRWKALNYKVKDWIPVLLMLNNGANIFGDFSLQRKNVFLQQVNSNYMNWNTPFWLDFNNEGISMLNIKRVNFPILKYRVYQGNYANNEIGKFNALNGELRTLTRLMSIYKIPMYHIQKKIFKLIRSKGIRRLKLTPYFVPIYMKKETDNKEQLVEDAILNTYGKDYKNNKYLNALVQFYKNKNYRKVIIKNLKIEDIYKGKDIRIFAEKLYSNELPNVYNIIFSEMEKGFNEIIVKDKIQQNMCLDLIKFLNIYPYVKVSINDSVN